MRSPYRKYILCHDFHFTLGEALETSYPPVQLLLRNYSYDGCVSERCTDMIMCNNTLLYPVHSDLLNFRAKEATPLKSLRFLYSCDDVYLALRKF